MTEEANWPAIVSALRQKLGVVETERDQARARVKGLEIVNAGLKAQLREAGILAKLVEDSEKKTDRFGREEGAGYE